MNSFVIGIALLTVSASFESASGVCIHVKNDDMLEYSCVGGRPTDLNTIPSRAEKIRISEMRIPIITTDMFFRFGPTLWVLSCSRCDITDIESNAFRALVNLQQLSLNNNRLTTVKASWFEGFEYLTYLDLNYNQITTIEDGAFEKLGSLVDLRLSGNRFECLNLRAMERLGQLKRMFLGENPELKCPNAISKFLADRKVIFDRDPEWRDVDPVSVTELPSTTEERSFTYWSTSPPVPPTNEDTTTSRFFDSTVDRPDNVSDMAHRRPYPSEITTPQPSWYPPTRPWTSVKEEQNGEYYKRIGYTDETTVTTPLATSPMDRVGFSTLLDPRDTASARPPVIYETSDRTLPDPNYHLRDPSWDTRQMEENNKDKDPTMSQSPVETTTDVPFPECPRSSSPQGGALSLNEAIAFVFLTFLANLIV